MNLNKSNRNCQPYPIFHDEASPYLSPLIGLNSSDSSFCEENLLNFGFEEEVLQNYQIINHELDNSIQVSLSQERSSSPSMRSSDQEIKEDRVQVQTPSYIAKPSDSKVEYKIPQTFLVENDKLSDVELRTIGRPLHDNIESFEFVFQTLMRKFKKLKKTKEEMTKYCMRKAFKFVNDSKKGSKKKGSSSSKDTKQEDESIQFQLPFKKNSSQKTMNNQFLKQIFSKKEFASEYRKFLNDVHELIEEDNDNKIIYLSNMIEGYLMSDQLQKVEGIKRLPWTQSILKRTQNLAFNMIQFSQETTDVFPVRSKKQRN